MYIGYCYSVYIGNFLGDGRTYFSFYKAADTLKKG